MAFTETPIYSQEQIKKLRLDTCKMCIFSACNGNQANKCSIETLVCTKSNDQNVLAKTSDINETCPMKYWDFTNEKIVSWPSAGGCGCGK